MSPIQFLLASLFILSALPAHAQSGADFVWGRIGRAERASTGLGLATSEGDAIVTGYYQGTATFGSETVNSPGNMTFFLARYTAAGELRWIRIGGGIDAVEQGRAVTVDAEGNIFAVSSLFTVFFTPIRTFDHVTLRGTGAVLLKYDASGELLWAKFVSETSSTATGVAAGPDGTVYVTGFFAGSVAIGNDSLTSSSASDNDLFVARFDADGNAMWARQAGSAGMMDLGYGIAVDGAGNAYVTGALSSGFGPAQPSRFGDVTVNERGFFLASYNSEGTLRWVKAAPGVKSEGRGVAVDPGGDVVVTGGFGSGLLNPNGEEKASFGGFTLSTVGADDIFVAKYSVDGEVLWAVQAGGKSDDKGYAITVDEEKNVYVTGNIFGSAVFDFEWVTGMGSCDIFVAKYTSGGELVWARAGGAREGSGDYGWGIGATGVDEVFVTGIITGTSVFGESRLEPAAASDGWVFGDMYLARMAPGAVDRRLWKPLNTGLPLNNRNSNPAFGAYLQLASAPLFGALEIHDGRLFASLLEGQGVLGPLSDGGVFVLDAGSTRWESLHGTGNTDLVSIGETLLAGGDGIYRSDDGGRSWHWRSVGTLPGSTPREVSVLQLEVVGDDLFAATNNGVYRSSDLGETWVRPADAFLWLSHAEDVLFVSSGGFPGSPSHNFRSVDRGETWMQITDLPQASDETYPPMISTVVDVDGAFLAGTGLSSFAGGAFGILRSEDRGITWKPFGTGLPMNWLSKTFEPVHALVLHEGVLYAGTDGGLYLSNDGGEYWQDANGDMPVGRVIDIAITMDRLYVAIHQHGVWYRPLNPSNVAIDEQATGTPVMFALEQNYPNPFNPSTTISFSLSEPGHVRLVVYDLLGRVVQTLADEMRGTGRHELHFDAADLPSGVYFFQLEAGRSVSARKMLLLR